MGRILAAHAVVPIALPGLMAQVPRILLDPEGPLVLRWTSLPHTWRWLMRLRGAANLPQVRRTAAAMHQLYASAVQRHLALAREAGVPELVSTDNGLYVHRDVHGIDLANGLAWQLRREHGARIEVLEGAGAARGRTRALARLHARRANGSDGPQREPAAPDAGLAALLRALGAHAGSRGTRQELLDRESVTGLLQISAKALDTNRRFRLATARGLKQALPPRD